MTRARDLADYIAQGVSSTELDILDGLTTTTAELNILDGATTTTAELNYNDTGAAVGTVVASKTVTVDANKDASSFRNITMAGDLSIGGDIITASNATLDLAPNGTGTVVVRGNNNSGAIVFNCESNSHGQKVFGQPHSASVTNTLMLPAGANSTLVSLVSADTLTNKTLTSPKINEDVAVTSTATELNLLDGVTATTAELNYLDIATLGTSAASKVVTSDANNVVTFSGGISEDSVTISSSSNAATINLREGTSFLHDLTENVTYTFSNPAASGNSSIFTLKIIQGSSARAITWPSSVDWPAATAPTLTATDNGVDIFVFQTIDGGTTYYGFVAGQAFG